MDRHTIAEFRAELELISASLDADDTLGEPSQKTVTLDQQSIGRLSRQDALQQQAMAKASQTRRNLIRLRIKAAMERMDEEEFGYCTECGEVIPLKRLRLDPTTPTCVSCARG